MALAFGEIRSNFEMSSFAALAIEPSRSHQAGAEMDNSKRIIIMGAAGRDFHNFNVIFRDHPEVKVVAFTAFQIPNIAGRTYPPGLAGEFYPEGVPIHREEVLPQLIRKLNVDQVIFSYSDVSYNDVMRRAALVNASGADFCLLNPKRTMLHSSKPVISICATRTGCGKSQTARSLTHMMQQDGLKVAVIRHPMPYGDLLKQSYQRFATYDDLKAHNCTIEEREEYEKHIAMGHVVYAGVDYGLILRAAEEEADVLLWDGGNNDSPFIQPDLQIVLTDSLRPGDELAYYPGETNLRMAHLVLITKVSRAKAKDIEQIRDNISSVNSAAEVFEVDSVVSAEAPEEIAGKRVLVIEDGPTVTHGGMAYGAGYVAAQKFGAAEIVDPRPWAVESIKDTFRSYPHLKAVLPAMGYGEEQMRQLKETIERVPCDLVLVGTPFDLARLLDCSRPLMRISYELDAAGEQYLRRVWKNFQSQIETVSS